MVRQVREAPFLLALSVPSAAIHEPVRRRIATIVLIIVLLAVVGSAATVLLTQPLVRRMAFYARTLEDQLQAHTRALAESEERYRTMFEESPLGVALYDADGMLQAANRALLELFGFDRAPDAREYRLFDATGLEAGAAARVRRGESVRDVFEVDFSSRHRHRYPTSRRETVGFFERLITPLGGGTDGTPTGYVVQVLEVTEQTLARRRMAKSLEEKKVLLREVHHRVKNNLQIVSSLLSLKLAHTEDPPSRKTLEESRMRITSMALIHEHLYQSESLAQIPFADYLRSLVYSIAQTHQAETKAVEVRVVCAPVALTMEEAIPCGLIVNELVENAFEHAFPGRERGLVTVHFGVEDDDRCVGVVEDDGVGLSEGFSLEELRSLGVKLVQSLIAQLDGELAVAGTDNGVRWTFSFPREPAEPAPAVAG
jgi:two-component sensor histidine kinase